MSLYYFDRMEAYFLPTYIYAHAPFDCTHAELNFVTKRVLALVILIYTNALAGTMCKLANPRTVIIFAESRIDCSMHYVIVHTGKGPLNPPLII